MKTASTAASSIVAQATSWPWCPSKIACFRSSALDDGRVLLVPEGHARPARQVRAVLEEHGGVHVRNGQLLAKHRQCRDMRRMRGEDAAHVGPGAIDPQMEPGGGIRHPIASDRMQVVVEEQQVARRHVVEALAEAAVQKVPACSARAVICPASPDSCSSRASMRPARDAVGHTPR